MTRDSGKRTGRRGRENEREEEKAYNSLTFLLLCCLWTTGHSLIYCAKQRISRWLVVCVAISFVGADADAVVDAAIIFVVFVSHDTCSVVCCAVLWWGRKRRGNVLSEIINKGESRRANRERGKRRARKENEREREGGEEERREERCHTSFANKSFNWLNNSKNVGRLSKMMSSVSYSPSPLSPPSSALHSQHTWFALPASQK